MIVSKAAEKKNKRKLWVYSMSTLFLMIVIFAFSSQPAAESEQSSGMVMRIIQSIFGSIMPEEILSFWVRKAAHMCIYFALGCSVRLLVGQVFFFWKGWESAVGKRGLVEFLTAVFLCFLYACSDEWHQTFVPGRSGELRDVGIDAIGFVLASALISLCIGWIQTVRASKR